ncbi:MAG: M56 family metallopeptidase [Planctomycetota bacterium]
MGLAIEGLTSTAWAQCWQVTALILAVWFAVRVAARNRPHLASVLWLVVLMKCVTPPIWSSPCGLFSWLQSEHTLVSSPATSALELESHPGQIDGDSDATVVQMDRSGANLDRQQPEPAAAIHPPLSLFSLSGLIEVVSNWSGLMALIWLIGGIGGASLATIRWLVCWRRLRSAGEIDSPEVVLFTENLRRRLGLRHPVRVLISRSPVGPAVVGIFRPTIILPALIVESKTTAELEPLLAHELIHIRRGDLWVGPLQLLTQVVWWFHPLVRLSNRLLTQEAERCCDEEVIASLGCEPGRYARSLVDVLALKRTLQPVPAFPGVRPVDVTSQRLERIMRLGQGCHKHTPRWCWLVMLLTAAITIPGAAYIAASEEPPKDLPTPTKAETAPDTPPATTPAAQTSTIEFVWRAYEVQDLIEQIKKIGGESEDGVPSLLTDPVARKVLVENALWVATRTPQKRTLVRENLAPSHNQQPTPIAQQPAINWKGNTLEIAYSAAGHARIERQFQQLREDGFQQLSIRTEMITGPAADVATIPIKWQLLDQAGADADRNVITEEFPVDGDKRPIRGQVETFVEKYQPAVAAVADRLLVETIIKNAQANKNNSLLFAPVITVYNGNTAIVEDYVSRPLSSPIQSYSDPESHSSRIYEEGWFLHCRPKLTRGGAADPNPIKLDFSLTQREIRGIEKSALNATGKQKGVAPVGIPELATTKISAGAEMQNGQTLLIGGLTTRSADGKTRQPFLVLVRVLNVTPPTAADMLAAAAAPPVATPNSGARPSTPRSTKTPEIRLVRGSRDEQITNTTLETRVYAIADLVSAEVNRPTLLFADGDRNITSKPLPPEAVEDMEPLINAIRMLTPTAWDKNHGMGTIKIHDPTKAFVVKQLPSEHEKTANLLRHFRNSQDQKMTLAVERVEVTLVELQKWTQSQSGVVGSGIGSAIQGMRSPTLTISREAESFLRHAGGVKIQQGPTLTLRNGQRLELKPTATTKTNPCVSCIQLLPWMSPDLPLQPLHVAADISHGDQETLLRHELPTIPPGATLLIDVSESAWIDQSPLVGFLGSFFSKPAEDFVHKSPRRQFYLVKSKVMEPHPIEEQEELLTK